MIRFDELFDFNDLTPIDQMIEKIARLNSVYENLTQRATSQSERYAAALNDILQAADKLEKQIESLDATEKGQQDTIAKTATQADKLTRENDKYTAALKETQAQIELLNEQQKRLTESKERLKKANEAEAGSIKALKDQLKQAVADYERMGDATDQAVKQESLARIRELSKTVKDADSAVKDAKKGSDLLAGSYYELNKRVVEAKRQLKEMEGGLEGNSKEFQDLKKFVQEGSAQLKEFDKELGDNQRNVGNYESAIDALDNRFNGLIGNVRQTGEELLTLARSPWFALAGLIVGAFTVAASAVRMFYTTTNEGEDTLEDHQASLKAFSTTLKTAFTELGKTISDSLGGNVIEGAIQNLIIRYLPGLAGLYNNLKENIKETIVETRALDDVIVEATIRNSIEQLRASELLEKSKNKALFTDQQRLEFLRQAQAIETRITEENIAIEKERLRLHLETLANEQTTHDERNAFLRQEIDYSQEGLRLLAQQINESNVLGEVKQEIADKVAAIIDLEARHFEEQKRNTSQISALELEIERERIDRARREIDAERALNRLLLQEEEKRNQDIVDDERETLTARLEALNAAAQARIDALEIEKAAELDVVQRAAEDRIRAEGKRVTAELLAEDRTLALQREAILEKFAALVEDVNQRTLDAVENNVFRQLSRDAQEMQDDTTTVFNEMSRGLEEAFKRGDISAAALMRNREDLAREHAREMLLVQIQGLEEQKKALESYGYDVSAIDAQISSLRLQISKSTNDEILAGLEQIKGASIDLAFSTFDAVGEILRQSSERNIAYLEDRLAQEEKAKEASLKIVGDDAQAREFIEAASAERQKEIQREINAEKRKAAIYDKAVSLTQATAQGALAVVRALASTVPPLNFILAALVGSAAALQIGTIAAAPIPEFWKGTESSPEGFAWLAERGRELVITPRGEAELVEGKQIRYLEKGTKVLPNPTTESLLADAKKYGDGYLGEKVLGSFKSGADEISRPQVAPMDTERIVGALGGLEQKVVSAIKSAPQDVYDEKGYRRYESTLSGRVVILNKRYKL